MAYIKSHTVLLRHRKNVDLANDLRLKPVYAMGHLHALWHEVLEQQEDGDLSKWSDKFIADCAAFNGSAPQFVQLLQKHGWLEKDRKLHDWLDYAGEYLKSKYRRRNRKRLEEIWNKHGRVYGKEDDEKEFVPGTSPGTVHGKSGADKIDRQTNRRDGSGDPGTAGTHGVPKPQSCAICKGGVFDGEKYCLDCRLCSQCREPSEDLKITAGPTGDLRLCQMCRKVTA